MKLCHNFRNNFCDRSALYITALLLSQALAGCSVISTTVSVAGSVASTAVSVAGTAASAAATTAAAATSASITVGAAVTSTAINVGGKVVNKLIDAATAPSIASAPAATLVQQAQPITAQALAPATQALPVIAPAAIAPAALPPVAQ